MINNLTMYKLSIIKKHLEIIPSLRKTKTALILRSNLSIRHYPVSNLCFLVAATLLIGLYAPYTLKKVDCFIPNIYSNVLFLFHLSVPMLKI